MKRPRLLRRRSALVAWRRAMLARMAASRTATLRLLARLPEADVLRRRTQGAWSIKEVLVHIAAWEEEGTRRLRLIARRQPHRMIFYDTMAEADAFNAHAVRGGRRASLPRVLARLARARIGLVVALKQLPPRTLADPAHELPVTTWLREFAWTHEQAHRQAIRRWREARRGTPRD